MFGTSKKWQFVCRTTPGVSKALQPLEDAIHQKLIPALCEEKFISEDFRKVLSLPARLGGLGILNPVEEADFEYQNSLIITAELADAVFLQKNMYSVEKAA